jgi:hypothetical protein
MQAVPPRLRPEGAPPGAAEQHRSSVPLQQAVLQSFVFNGLLLLETSREMHALLAPSTDPSAETSTDPSAATGATAAPPAICSVPALLGVRVRGSVAVSQVRLPTSLTACLPAGASACKCSPRRDAPPSPQVRLQESLVRLGRVGYVTGWQPAPFTFTVINQSAVRTCVRLMRVPAIFEMRAPTAAEEPAAEIAGDRSLLLWLAPFQTRSVECSLTAAMLLTGTALEMRQTRAWHLEVSNVYNPANVGTLRITAKVTLLRLRYAGLRWHERHRSTDDPRSASGSVPHHELSLSELGC